MFLAVKGATLAQ